MPEHGLISASAADLASSKPGYSFQATESDCSNMKPRSFESVHNARENHSSIVDL
jgi:hypothetical protein